MSILIGFNYFRHYLLVLVQQSTILKSVHLERRLDRALTNLDQHYIYLRVKVDIVLNFGANQNFAFLNTYLGKGLNTDKM